MTSARTSGIDVVDEVEFPVTLAERDRQTADRLLSCRARQLTPRNHPLVGVDDVVAPDVEVMGVHDPRQDLAVGGADVPAADVAEHFALAGAEGALLLAHEATLGPGRGDDLRRARL